MQEPVLLIINVLFCSALAIYTNTSNGIKIEENPAKWTEEGIWGPLLEEWAITNHRDKRVLRLPTVQTGFAASDRVAEIVSSNEKESKIAPGKIVNDKKSVPGRQVSETDLYLLGAIEKLVYRADFMEKRLRKVEEMLYYVMAGSRMDTEPCRDNFTRAGTACYSFSTNAGREMDWKAASKQCKRNGATLAEMETIEENQDVVAYIQNTPYLRGKDFWIGGLNPGLLWIWSNSARPVSASGTDENKNPSIRIFGEGRCLRLAYDPALRTYAYKGTECSVRYSFICELRENTSSNEISRIGRSKNIFDDDEL